MAYFIPLNRLCRVLFFSLVSCKSQPTKVAIERNIQENQEYQIPDFCTSTAESSSMWSSERVQSEIHSLLSIDGYRQSAISAYSEVYLEMTKARDDSRCTKGGKLYSSDVWQRNMNSVLADIMTRNYVAEQRSCYSEILGESFSRPLGSSYLCDMTKQALAENWTSLEVAMASTAVYLSDILGKSLSALPYVDSLWVDTNFKTLDQRISAIQKFKPTYDSFNEFLAGSLKLVADVLIDKGRVHCRLFSTAADIAEDISIPDLFFKWARDKTFDLGVDLAMKYKGKQHPLVSHLGLWQPETLVVENDPINIEALALLKDHTNRMVRIFKSPLFKVFSNHGGRKYFSDRLRICGPTVQ